MTRCQEAETGLKLAYSTTYMHVDLGHVDRRSCLVVGPGISFPDVVPVSGPTLSTKLTKKQEVSNTRPAIYHQIYHH